MELFDSHAHYDDKRFSEDADEVIMNAYNSGVKYIINAGSDIKTSEKSIQFAEKFDFVYAAVGIHPHELTKLKDEDISEIEKMCLNQKVCAIGEIGLDYFYDFSPRDLQKDWLKKQLELAKKLNLPVIIHDRDSHEDIMKIIKEEAPFANSGVCHCFSGSWEMAKELLNLGFYISFGGPVTFKNAKKAIDIIKNVPMDRFLIETDSPYLTPEPFRGIRNDSSYVKYVAQKIAEIKETTIESIAEFSTNNAKTLFRIQK